MALSDYHLKYTKEPPERLDSRLRAKQHELIQVMEGLDKTFAKEVVTIAVLGCADRRQVNGHIMVFEEVLQKYVAITTFDITTEHLEGESNVITHDCRNPLPGGPYDITYSHLLLKFMPPEDQWKVVVNSYDALLPGGLALHIVNTDGKTEPTKMLENNFWDIPLDEFEKKLDEKKITYKRVSVKSGPDLEKDMTCWVIFR